MIDERWFKYLPRLNKGEAFIAFGAARHKYVEGVKTTRGVEFVLLTPDEALNKKSKLDPTKKMTPEEYITDKLTLLEGRTKLAKAGYPEESFVFYFDMNPKDLVAGYAGTCQLGLKRIVERNLPKLRSIPFDFYSQVHKHNSRHLFVLLDVDEKNPDLLNTINELLIEDVYYEVETHGGYHVIVRKTDTTRQITRNQIMPLASPLLDEEGNVQWHQDGNKWRQKMNITFAPRVQTPVPGTLQGGFEVKFLGGCLE
jgi:hypothetical protein